MPLRVLCLYLEHHLPLALESDGFVKEGGSVRIFRLRAGAAGAGGVAGGCDVATGLRDRPAVLSDAATAARTIMVSARLSCGRTGEAAEAAVAEAAGGEVTAAEGAIAEAAVAEIFFCHLGSGGHSAMP